MIGSQLSTLTLPEICFLNPSMKQQWQQRYCACKRLLIKCNIIKGGEMNKSVTDIEFSKPELLACKRQICNCQRLSDTQLPATLDLVSGNKDTSLANKKNTLHPVILW